MVLDPGRMQSFCSMRIIVSELYIWSISSDIWAPTWQVSHLVLFSRTQEVISFPCQYKKASWGSNGFDRLCSKICFGLGLCYSLVETSEILFLFVFVFCYLFCFCFVFLFLYIYIYILLLMKRGTGKNFVICVRRTMTLPGSWQ